MLFHEAVKCMKFMSVVRCSSYKNTLFLPKTEFPHKVNPSNRRERDRLIESTLKFEELYEWQRKRTRNNTFILHDGPPYANGDVHIGHAVNKILKDITIRQKLLQGYKVQYVPGWDCHGLPIELKVLKNNENIDALTVRKKAFNFSQKTKEKQLTSFKEWGVLGDWKGSYLTCHPDYIIEQLGAFQDLYDEGTIFQDYKPVFWSPTNRTSLAEAELEYNPDHLSKSVYVKFKIVKYADSLAGKLSSNRNLSAVIWTTTPWSLPANQAVCYSEEVRYSIVYCKSNEEHYLVAEELIPSLSKVLQTDLKLVQSLEGDVLKSLGYQHPIYKDKICPLYPAHHVTLTKGTGLVHTAPNHGLEDYLAAKKHGISLDTCLIDDDGNFTEDAGSELAGKFALKNGSDHILKILSEDILFQEDYVHSYPYDWRSKTPVIIKSSRQWFIDAQRFQAQAMECLENVKVFPDFLKKVFITQLMSCPQWCISRQRSWGVPIPAFYSCDGNTPLVHRSVTTHLCELIKKHGIHTWWELSCEQLLPDHLIKECGFKSSSYTRGMDIMDIWFDSGISWKNVLPDPHISDVCIEGIDQIRGWFNSSLMTSIALRGKAPYKSLVFHGFTTDAEGRKMSKSEGNIISPESILCGSKKDKMPTYGIDVLRWWVASHACQHENIALKNQVLEECSQNINKLRNVFKFLLGSLNNFHPKDDVISVHQLRLLDVYMLHLLLQFIHKVFDEYNSYQYKNVAKDVINFTTNEISSFYCHLIKDRLYCDPKDSIERLSCLTTLYFILNTLSQSIGAICPHLAEEVVMHHSNEEFARTGLFKSNWPSLMEYLSTSPFPTSVALANQIRQAIVKTDIKTLNQHAHIIVGKEMIEALQNLNSDAPGDSASLEFFQVSSLKINDEIPSSLPENVQFVKGEVNTGEGKSESFTVVLFETSLKKCARCRRYSSPSDELCLRCVSAISDFSKAQSHL